MSVIANILVSPEGWDIGSFSFRRLTDGKKHRQVYHRAVASLRKNVKERKSVLYEGGSEIYDIIFLYNFYLRGNACLEKDFIFFNRSISEGIRLNGRFQDCMNKSLEVIRKRNWKIDHQEKILAFNWLLRSRVNDELQIAFFNKWVVIELLEKYYNDIDAVLSSNLGVKNFLNFRKYWRDIRNGIAHEGHCHYAYFRKGLLGKFSNGTPRFTNEERRLFRSSIGRKDFGRFQADSEFIMDIILTIYFSHLLGMNNFRDYFHHFYIENLQYYDSNLSLPPPKDTKVIFKVYKKQGA